MPWDPFESSESRLEVRVRGHDRLLHVATGPVPAENGSVIRSIDAARRYLADRGVAIADRTAIEMVKTLLSPSAVEQDLKAEIRGRDDRGIATTIVITSVELRDAIRRTKRID